MLVYAPQRQMLPLIHSRISSSEAAWPSWMQPRPDMICPEVQYPLSTSSSLSAPLTRIFTTVVSPCAGGDSASQPASTDPAITAPPTVADAPTTNVRRFSSACTGARVPRRAGRLRRVRLRGIRRVVLAVVVEVDVAVALVVLVPAGREPGALLLRRPVRSARGLALALDGGFLDRLGLGVRGRAQQAGEGEADPD